MSELPEQPQDRPEGQKRGRPPKLTPQVRDDLLKWLRNGLPLELAARMAGTHDATVRAWRAKSRSGVRGYKGFDADVEQALAEGEGVNVARIVHAGKSNWRAAAWLLERQFPNKYGPPPPPLPLQVPDVPPLSADEARSDDQAGL